MWVRDEVGWDMCECMWMGDVGGVEWIVRIVGGWVVSTCAQQLMRLTAPSSGDIAQDINHVPDPIPDTIRGRRRRKRR